MHRAPPDEFNTDLILAISLMDEVKQEKQAVVVHNAKEAKKLRVNRNDYFKKNKGSHRQQGHDRLFNQF